jgi:hypothetical protein
LTFSRTLTTIPSQAVPGGDLAMATQYIASLFMFFLLCVPAVHAQRMSDYTGPVFPPDNALNTRIDSLPVLPNSANLVASIGANTALHPDFGTTYDDNGTLVPSGIPYNVVGAAQPLVPIVFTLYGDESDPGPWPIPANPFIEGVFDWRTASNGDRHLLVVDSSNLCLYESGNVTGNSDGSAWQGSGGAVFHLDSDTLRPETWTSADAAGLPIFPLLIRYDEVERALAAGGELHHTIRFTVVNSRRAYVWPARHYASGSTDTNRPAMGQRFRLKASVDISAFSPRMQVILRTMKLYGLIVADNGSNWFFQGTHDDRWDDNDLNTLKSLHGSDFEAVDISPWKSRPGFDRNSGRVPPEPASTSTRFPANPIPDAVTLYQNFPNPFNPSTQIQFALPRGSLVDLSVSNILGQRVATIAHEFLQAGSHRIRFDGSGLASGPYFLYLRADRAVRTIRLLLVR